MNLLALAATTKQELGTIGGAGLGPFANLDSTDPKAGLVAFSSTISALIGIMTIGAGIWFIFQFLIGGFFWITSGGDKNKLHEARERLTNALIGLVIVVSSWALIAITGQFLGIDIFLTQPGTIMETLQLK